MEMIKRIRHLGMAWAAAAMLLSPGQAMAGTTTSGSLTVTETGGGTRTRDYRLFTPTSLPAGTPALVIVLHGGGGNADTAALDSFEGLWNDKADARQFFVVYPEAKLQTGEVDQRNWNDCRAPATAFDGAGRPTDGGMDPANPRYSDWDDVAFIDQLVDRFVSPPVGSGITAVDPNRIFLVGASNGGMMTQRMAIQSPGRYRAFSSIVGHMPSLSECGSPDTTALRASGRRMLFLYGESDPLMPPAGGYVGNNVVLGGVTSASATITQWNTWWGVTASGSEVAQANPITTDGPSRQYWTYHCDTTCPSGTLANMGSSAIRMFVVRVNGAGHTVPGVSQIPLIRRLIVGYRNLDIRHVDTMTTFFGL